MLLYNDKNQQEGGCIMNIKDLFLGQVKITNSVNMIGIYLLVLIVAFIVCMIISQKLNVYTTGYKKEIKSKFDTKFQTGIELQRQVLEEVAATADNLRGAEDER